MTRWGRDPADNLYPAKTNLIPKNLVSICQLSRSTTHITTMASSAQSSSSPIPAYKTIFLQSCLSAEVLTFGTYTLKSGRSTQLIPWQYRIHIRFPCANLCVLKCRISIFLQCWIFPYLISSLLDCNRIRAYDRLLPRFPSRSTKTRCDLWVRIPFSRNSFFLKETELQYIGNQRAY